MDGQIGSVIILPDQMQVINAALILIFIPIFDKGIYPLAGRGLFCTIRAVHAIVMRLSERKTSLLKLDLAC